MSFKAIVLLLAAGQGLLLSLALLTPRRKQNKSNVFLGLMMVVVSLVVLNSWGMKVQYHSQPNRFPFWVFESYLILPVALWFFVQINTNPSYRFRPMHLLAFLPALFEIIAESCTLIYARLSGNFFRLLDVTAWMVATEVVPPVAMLAVLGLYSKNLWQFNREYKNVLFKTGIVQVTRLYGIFIVFGLLTLLWIAEVILSLPVFAYTEWFLTVFLFALGYLGYFQPQFFELSHLKRKGETATGYPQFNDQKELEKLTALIADRTLHRRPKLSLEDLSVAMDRPARYVSYLINHYHGKNFHDYINGWRVKEVITRINDPREKHKTLLALAFESGFNSKSAFNQIFKSHTGRTPSELMKAK